MCGSRDIIGLYAPDDTIWAIQFSLKSFRGRDVLRKGVYPPGEVGKVVHFVLHGEPFRRV